MSKNNSRYFRKHLSVLFILILGFSSIVSARPQNLRQDDLTNVKKLPPPHYVRSHDYDMRHIALDLHFDWESEQTIGKANITLAPLVPKFDTVNLDAGLMVINSVRLNGKTLTFNYNEKETLLKINLDRVYSIGEPLTLNIDYRTTGKTVENTLGFGGGGGIKFVKPTADNPNGRRQIWSQGETDYNRFWFPSYDSPNDFATTEITATVEKPLTVISNGELLETKDNGDNTRTFHWKMDTPHANYLTSIVVGEYAEVKGEYAGIPVSSYVFPNELAEGAATTKRLPLMVKFFSEKTGVKYPYVKYAQTMATGFNGGMENISATTMTPNMIHDERELIDNDSDSLQSHELAHQWFGDYVTTREWGHIWLNESFATYFEALWMEESKGHDYFLYNDVYNNQQASINTWKQGNRRPIVTMNYVDKDSVFDTYAYPRGGAVLHMLRKHLGDELFFKALNHYLTANANKPVQTEQLRIAIEEATGQSMDWFFDEWLYKMGQPVFEVTKNYDNASKQLTLNVKQTQKIDSKNEYPQVEFFQTYVDVEIDDKIERVWIKPQAENIFTFASPTEPKLVNFDYQSTLIKELKFEKTTDELIYQLRRDSDVLGRLWAMNELVSRRNNANSAEAEKGKIMTALVQTITADAFWEIRRDAINAILPKAGQNSFDAANTPKFQMDETIKKTLLTAAKDQNSNVRAAAISGLGLSGDEKLTDVYLGALSDQSYAVIDAASLALGLTKSPQAYDALVKLSGENSWKDRIRIAGLNGLAVLGDKKALETGFKYSEKSFSANLRNPALRIVASTGKGDARAFPLIFENFKKALDNNQTQAVIGILQSFVRLADPRGQQAFDLAKEKFKDRQNLLNFVNQLETQFKSAVAGK